MRAVARSLLRDENRVDDVEQETWLAALGQPGLRRAGLRGWLARVTRNFARKDLRAEGRRRAREAAVAGPDLVLVDRVSREKRLVTAVLDLPEPYRTSVLLRFHEGLSPREIAAREGVPAGTVRSRLSRALDLLRARLGGDEDRGRRLAVPPAGIGALIVSTKAKVAVAAILLLLIAVGVYVGAGPRTPEPPPERTDAADALPMPATGTGHGAEAAGAAADAVTGILATVFDRITLDPIPGATVRAGGAEAVADAAGITRTAADGEGPWRLAATAEGYAPGEALVLEPERGAEIFLLPERLVRRGLPDHMLIAGGIWLGPAGRVPPMSRSPRDPQPPPEAPDFYPSIPATADPDPRPRRCVQTFADWEFWWAWRREEILAGRTIPRPHQSAGEVAGLLRDRLDAGDLPIALLPTAAIALGAHGDAADADRLLALTRRDTDRVFLESVILALGLLGAPERPVVDYLHGVLADPAWPPRARAYAAVSLGLLGAKSREAASVLEASLDWREKYRDLPAAKLLGLALAGRREWFPRLARVVDDGDVGRGAAPHALPDGPPPPVRPKPRPGSRTGGPAAPGGPGAPPPPPAAPAGPVASPGAPPAPEPPPVDPVARAWAVAAIAWIDGPDAAGTVLARGIEDQAGHRAVALALGRLADDPAEVLGIVERTDDPTCRRYALIALGRIAARRPAAREACVTRLRAALGAGEAQDRAFAAVGLALAGAREDAPALAALLDGDDDSLRGAAAIALGLLADRESVPKLLALLEEPANLTDLRGACAEALGLIGAEEARRPLARILVDPREGDLWRPAAAALGRLGGPDAEAVLFSVLRSPFADTFALGAAADALADLADADTVRALLALSEDDARIAVQRVTALGALARICDRREVPLAAEIAGRVDYRAMVPFLSDLIRRLP